MDILEDVMIRIIRSLLPLFAYHNNDSYEPHLGDDSGEVDFREVDMPLLRVVAGAISVAPKKPDDPVGDGVHLADLLIWKNMPFLLDTDGIFSNRPEARTLVLSRAPDRLK